MTNVYMKFNLYLTIMFYKVYCLDLQFCRIIVKKSIKPYQLCCHRFVKLVRV